MNEISVRFLGHACILIQSSKTILIDPFIRNNPLAAIPIEQIPKIDYLLLTHDHFDHYGDTVELLKRDNPVFIAIMEVTEIPEIKVLTNTKIDLNIGGTYSADGIVFHMTPAIHSSGVGAPAGFVIELNGKKIYHSGDTSYFSGLKDITELYGTMDIACLPIGGHYTMDITQAALAVSALNPKVTIPIHYNTWPPIQADPQQFAELAKPHAVHILKPGETVTI